MGKEFDRLIEIVARLRAPDGCPWDREQTHKSILNHLIEEAYEFIDATENDSKHHMEEELGDLLLQVVLHAQMGSEENTFDIESIAREINEKLIRRHPHVFGSTHVNSSEEVLVNWDAIKKEEKGKEHRKYVCDDVPLGLPALSRAEKIQKRVRRVGFDWKDPKPIFDKVEEEFREFRQAYESGNDEHAAEELGDILFALVNVARHHHINAEDALRATTKKFERRFRYIEDRLAEMGKVVQGSTLEEMDNLWNECKVKEKETPK